MAKNVEHLESLGANVDTVEPFNESETSYWGTPGDMASKYTDESDDNTKLINNYWDKYYSDKDRSVTPYSNAEEAAGGYACQQRPAAADDYRTR